MGFWKRLFGNSESTSKSQDSRHQLGDHPRDWDARDGFAKVEHAIEVGDIEMLKKIVEPGVAHGWRLTAIEGLNDEVTLRHIAQTDEDMNIRLKAGKKLTGKGRRKFCSALLVCVRQKLFKRLMEAQVYAGQPTLTGQLIVSGQGSRRALWTWLKANGLRGDGDAICHLAESFGNGEFNFYRDAEGKGCFGGCLQIDVSPYQPQVDQCCYVTFHKLWILRTGNNRYAWAVENRSSSVST